MVVFKMRESVPIARYSPVCNVLRQWKTSLILTYRVYRLYDKNKNKNKNKKPKWRFLTSRGAHVNCAIMAILYTHAIGNQPSNTMVVFKMRESVPIARYSPVCNVLRQWKTSLILTYRVYRLYDSYSYSSPVDLPR